MPEDKFTKNDLLVSEKLGALESRMTGIEKGQTEGFALLTLKLDAYHKRSDDHDDKFEKHEKRISKTETTQKFLYRDVGILGTILFVILTYLKEG